MEHGRLRGPEADHGVGLGHVPGSVHEGRDRVVPARFTSCGQSGDVLQLGVQHALHTRHVGHRHPLLPVLHDLRPLGGT